MTAVPELPLATGSLALDGLDEPLLVDPGPPLLADALAALRAAAPDRFDPTLDELRAAARAGTDPLDAADDLPRLRVLARTETLAAVTEGFHEASRVAAMVEAGVLSPSQLDARQPNVVLAGDETGMVLVEGADGTHRVGADPSLGGRYADLVAAAPSYDVRTPSRHRIYRAFHSRCGEAVADDVVRLLDRATDLDRGDVVGPRVRPYLAGARHGVLHYDLRRAGEEGGLGSPSTFSSVKARLVDAGLVTTEKVDQPVGRPRQRLVATDALAGCPLAESVRVARETLRDEEAAD